MQQCMSAWHAAVRVIVFIPFVLVCLLISTDWVIFNFTWVVRMRL